MYKKPHLRLLINEYEIKKDEIRKRLREFRDVGKGSDKEIFAELCYCILTPQSKARVCDYAVKRLVKSRALFKGSESEIRGYLQGVRFPNNKARYLVEARNIFSKDGEIRIKDKIGSFGDVRELRAWLVKEVRGIGFKEASHFLRNIGKGEKIAILDRHVLKNLEFLGVVCKPKKSLFKGDYLKYESKIEAFAKYVNIPLDELDLLLWSRETGEILK